MEGDAVFSPKSSVVRRGCGRRNQEWVHDLVEGAEEASGRPRHRGRRRAHRRGLVALDWTTAPDVAVRPPEPRLRVPRANDQGPVDRRNRRDRRVRRSSAELSRIPPPGPHPRYGRHRTVRVPRLCLAAAPGQPHGVDRAVEAPRPGRVGRVGDELPERERVPPRLAPTRTVAPLPARRGLPAGPGSDDAVLTRCSYVDPNGVEWVEKSLLVDRTTFTRDVLVRAQGRVEPAVSSSAGWCRRGGQRTKAFRVGQEAFSPPPLTTPSRTNLRPTTSAVARAPDRIDS